LFNIPMLKTAKTSEKGQIKFGKGIGKSTLAANCQCEQYFLAKLLCT